MTEQTQQPQQPQDLGPALNLNLHLAEVNFILAVLAKAHFEQVEGLIAKIRQQGQAGIAAHQQAESLKAQTETNETGETK